MKKIKCFLVLLCFIIVIWLASMIHCSVLSNMYAKEFEDFNDVGFDNVVTHGWNPQIRVMKYSDSSAVVYYFDDYAGVQVSFQKVEGRWRFSEWLASWSTTGTADNYFIWPYFRNWVI